MSTTNGASLILVVDDERAIADTLVTIMQRAGYQSVAAYSARQALEVLQTASPALIISDVMMPEINGIDFAMQARELRPDASILLISGHAGSQDLMMARAGECSFDLMAKPVEPRELLAKIAEMLNRRNHAA